MNLSEILESQAQKLYDDLQGNHEMARVQMLKELPT
jgi:hypothetical protein